MKRRLPAIIDGTGFVGFVLLTTTGVLLRYVLPAGSGRFSTIWGFDRHEWGEIHFWIAVVFFSVLSVHLVLHWRFLRSVVTGRPREGSGLRAGLGIVGLAAVAALAISPLLASVEQEVPERGGAASASPHQGEGIALSGSMTLKDVEEQTGVPVDYLIDSLGLPRSASASDRLGLLRKRYGFEFNDVRRVVREYQSRTQ